MTLHLYYIAVASLGQALKGLSNPAGNISW
jgi:hypothetical protein